MNKADEVLARAYEVACSGNAYPEQLTVIATMIDIGEIARLADIDSQLEKVRREVQATQHKSCVDRLRKAIHAYSS